MVGVPHRLLLPALPTPTGCILTKRRRRRNDGGPYGSVFGAHVVSYPALEATQGQIDGLSANSHTNATRIGCHLWEIDLRFAPGLPPGWLFCGEALGEKEQHPGFLRPAPDGVSEGREKLEN